MNVVVINPDQMRWDYMSPTGHPFINTTNLTRLASEGTVCSHAFTPSPMCGPSRTSFLTGQYAIEHGVRNYAGTHSLDHPGALGALAEAGYRRALFGKDHTIYDDAIGTLYDEGEDICIGNMDAHPNYANSWDSGPLETDSPFNLTERLTTSAIAFIEHCNDGKQPFYVTVNYQDPHPYFACPEPYASLFSPDQFTLPKTYRKQPVSGEPKRLSNWREHSGALDMPDDALLKAMAMYCGQIRYVDDQLGRVLDTLDQLGIADDTIIVFWSDHGEFLGDFGVTHKCAAFYDCLVRVPLIIRDPTNRLQRGTYEGLVETVDVLPTVMDLLRLPASADSRGISLASDQSDRRDVFAEAGIYGKQPDQPVKDYRIKAPHDPSQWGPGSMLRTQDWKLVVYADGDGELFDLAADPLENTNQFDNPAHATTRSELMLRLLQRQQCQGQPPEHLPSGPRGVYDRNRASYPGAYEDHPKLTDYEMALPRENPRPQP